jgi:radical SAM superfamily enzyme YgiQ (UPF0313 family)
MRVLLVQPPNHSRVGLQAIIRPEPLGLEVVAASLEAEHQVEILDARLESKLYSKLDSFRPHAVGVSSSFTSDTYEAYAVLQEVKKYDPGIRTFTGGHHATVCHKEFFGRADVVVLGEAELTVPELIRAWERGDSLDRVDGIAFAGQQGWQVTSPRPLLVDLDQTPIPARHLTRRYQKRYYHGARRPYALVETSRGCPYRCKFCAVWRFYQGKYRKRSVQWVVNDILQVEAPHVFFCDDNFLGDIRHNEALCQAVVQKGIKKHFMAQVRADSVAKHTDLLRKWRDIGLEAVFIGFESVVQHGLDGLSKNTSVDDNDEAVRIVKKLGINVVASFIVDPGFSKADFATVRKYVQEKKLRMPVFSVLTPLPGTVLWEEKVDELTTNNYELFDLHHAVLPTSLGLKRFYFEYCRLYVGSYLNSLRSPSFLRLPSGASRLSWLTNATTTAKLLLRANPWTLAASHSR